MNEVAQNLWLTTYNSFISNGYSNGESVEAAAFAVTGFNNQFGGESNKIEGFECLYDKAKEAAKEVGVSPVSINYDCEKESKIYLAYIKAMSDLFEEELLGELLGVVHDLTTCSKINDLEGYGLNCNRLINSLDKHKQVMAMCFIEYKFKETNNKIALKQWDDWFDTK